MNPGLEKRGTEGVFFSAAAALSLNISSGNKSELRSRSFIEPLSAVPGSSYISERPS